MPLCNKSSCPDPYTIEDLARIASELRICSARPDPGRVKSNIDSFGAKLLPLNRIILSRILVHFFLVIVCYQYNYSVSANLNGVKFFSNNSRIIHKSHDNCCVTWDNLPLKFVIDFVLDSYNIQRFSPIVIETLRNLKVLEPCTL